MVLHIFGGEVPGGNATTLWDSPLRTSTIPSISMIARMSASLSSIILRSVSVRLWRVGRAWSELYGSAGVTFRPFSSTWRSCGTSTSNRASQMAIPWHPASISKVSPFSSHISCSKPAVRSNQRVT